MPPHLNYTCLLKHIRPNLTRSICAVFGGHDTTFSKNIQRVLITNSSRVSYPPKEVLVPFSKEQENNFLGYFPKVVESLEDSGINAGMDDVLQKLTTLLKYNVPNGEKIRGITTVASYIMLEKSHNLTTENLELANMLGWCAEILDAAIMMAQDIIDNRETRGNVACWFRLPEVDTNATLDVFILEHCIYFLLKKFFSKTALYLPIVEFFHDIIYKVTTGHILNSQKFDIGHMDMNMFDMITEYRTGYYTFYFSVILGMYLSKVYNEELHRQAGPVLLEMGKFYQIRNYILNWYDKSELIVEDIVEGKCTWLIAIALQKANFSQRKIIEDCYGKQEEKAVQGIRELYKELKLPREFQVYKEHSFESVGSKIEKITNTSIRLLLNLLVKQLYGC